MGVWLQQNFFHIMKKALLVLCVGALSLASCTTVKNTATTKPVEVNVQTNTAADLDISQRKIEYTYVPTSQVKRGGFSNVLSTAVREALQKNGGGDVLVQLEYTATYKSGFFSGKKLKTITVTGFPATYRNFRNIK